MNIIESTTRTIQPAYCDGHEQYKQTIKVNVHHNKNLHIYRIVNLLKFKTYHVTMNVHYSGNHNTPYINFHS
jgi:hypothetical protein